MRKLVLSFLVVAALLLAGCSHPGNTGPADDANTGNNVTFSEIPPAPAGMDWYPIKVNGRTYQYPVKDERDAQYVGLIAETRYGVAWINPLNRQQILLSPSGTSFLQPAHGKVIYTCSLPAGKDSRTYACDAEWLDVSEDAPDLLFWRERTYDIKDPWLKTMDVHALNLKTGKDRLIVRNVRIGGGYNCSVAYKSHYLIYNQETPTATEYIAHIHVVDLNTGEDRLVWTGESDKMTGLSIPLDGEQYTPKWTG